MEMLTGQEQAAVAPEPARKSSLWEDVVDAFVSPAELYRRQAEGGWVKPWIVVSVLTVAIFFLFLGPNHEVAVASSREVAARMGRQLPEPGMGGQIFSGIFQPVLLLIGIIVSGFLLWVAAAVAQGGPRFKQAMMIVSWALLPTILQKVVVGVLVLMKTGSGEELNAVRDTSTGVLRFLDPGSLALPLVSALSLVDVFAFWQLILWLVALKVICHYTTGKATAVAVATWVLMLPLAMGMGFLGQLAMGG